MLRHDRRYRSEQRSVAPDRQASAESSAEFVEVAITTPRFTFTADVSFPSPIAQRLSQHEPVAERATHVLARWSCPTTETSRR